MTSVVLHQFTPRLTAIEFGTEDNKPQNFLVVVGGLGDGLATVPYFPKLGKKVYSDLGGKWVVVQPLLSSSYSGWGTSSLKKDCNELASLVTYLRKKRGSKNSKVVILGHSTGCQDTMEYLSKHKKASPKEDIDGAILQAPVSDSEAIEMHGGEKAKAMLELAERLLREGRGDEIMPEDARKVAFHTPVTAYRFHSLVSKSGDDDYFSTYLTDDDLKSSFGAIDKPLLTLIGGQDEFMPDFVNKDALLNRWQEATDVRYWSKYSKVVPGALHNVGPKSLPGAEDELLSTIMAFITETFQ